MSEKVKKTGACSTSFPPTSIMKSSILYKVLFGHYIPPKTKQITKINKVEYYYKDKMGRKQKKNQKVKSKKGRRFRTAKFCIVRNFAGVTKSRNPCKIVLFSTDLLVCLLVMQL